MMHHVANPAAIVEGAERLLMPGGHFYALENNASPVRFIFDVLMKIQKLWNEEAGIGKQFWGATCYKSNKD